MSPIHLGTYSGFSWITVKSSNGSRPKSDLWDWLDDWLWPRVTIHCHFVTGHPWPHFEKAVINDNLRNKLITKRHHLQFWTVLTVIYYGWPSYYLSTSPEGPRRSMVRNSTHSDIFSGHFSVLVRPWSGPRSGPPTRLFFENSRFSEGAKNSLRSSCKI